MTIKQEMIGIAYNNCYGGFSLSEKAIKRGREISNDPLWGGPCLVGDLYEDGHIVDKFYGGGREISRHDPVLIQVIEELGSEADDDCANLIITKVPKGTLYYIDEYDGNETVKTQDTYDWEIAGS